MKNTTQLKHELKSLIDGRIKDIKRFDEILKFIEEAGYNNGSGDLYKKIKEAIGIS